MKLRTTVENGMVRIDFDPSVIKAGKFEEIYDYFALDSKTSKVTWTNNPTLLKKGVVIGYYNLFTADEAMIKNYCKSAENCIKDRSFEVE